MPRMSDEFYHAVLRSLLSPTGGSSATVVADMIATTFSDEPDARASFLIRSAEGTVYFPGSASARWEGVQERLDERLSGIAERWKDAAPEPGNDAPDVAAAVSSEQPVP